MMHVELHTDIGKFNLPDHARLWIFQSDRILTDEEAALITRNGKRFAEQWRAHGKDLTAEFEVIRHAFVVMAIDEEAEGASGCSIDTFMRFILETEKQSGLNLTNRLCFAFEADGGRLTICKANTAKEYIEKGILTPDTEIFDNLIKTLGELRSSWLKPAKELWVKQYFNPSST